MKRAVALALLLAACDRPSPAPSKPPPPAIDPATAGTLRGTVAFEGTPPRNPKLPIGGSPDCAVLHSESAVDEIYLIKDGKLRNAFVYVKEGLEALQFPWPDAPVTMANARCIYTPRVVGAQVNQRIVFTNEDPTLHNVHGFSRQGDFNFSLLSKGVTGEITARRPEVMITVKCDVHPWMLGYIGVVAHPFFAVTGEDGAFEFKGLPPGDYVVEAWHERLGTQTRRVTLEAKGAATADFRFSAK